MICQREVMEKTDSRAKRLWQPSEEWKTGSLHLSFIGYFSFC
ncbi:hypothetical protein CHCC20487_2160 [Bacillus licheniformis]|nr:hypothetical protein CHCC20487_2160 [Bacillus licheniformis]